MSFIESDRMSGVSGSIIRELFKMTAAPDMISFAGGNPSPDTFPMEEMAAIAKVDKGVRYYHDSPELLAQYATMELGPDL